MLANPKIKKGLIGVLIVVIGYMFVLPRFQAAELIPAPEFPNPGPTLTLEGRVYNLDALSGEQQRYLKLGVVFEFETEDAAFLLLEGEPLTLALELFEEELHPKSPLIDDLVGAVVNGKTLDEIASPAGRQSLKDELMEGVGAIVGEPHLLNVYFTEFVFQ